MKRPLALCLTCLLGTCLAQDVSEDANGMPVRTGARLTSAPATRAETTSDTVVVSTLQTIPPPAIERVQRSSNNVTSSEKVTVTFRVKDLRGAGSVNLIYSPVSTGTSVTLPAFDDGVGADAVARDGIFTASIPEQPTSATVTYRCSATDIAGQTAISPEQSYTVQPAPRPELRVMQVDSWARGVLTAEEIENLVRTCRAANLNTIMAEVRKVGDADYDSTIEPRATNVAPDFDPLACLIKLGHDTSGGGKRIAVHGWFVMHRISKSENLDPRHVLVQHPDYEMLKSDGTRNVGNRYLDPGHPGTVDHNVAVILDCLSRYDMDGINCDYIRYPEDRGDWGYNAVSVARFNALHGRQAVPEGKDSDWEAWRRECISLELKKLYVKAWKMKPEALVTCDTINWGNTGFANYESSAPYSRAYQDWVGWLRDTILDYNAVMNYAPLSTSGTLRFQGWTNLSLENDSQRGSIIGIGAYQHSSIQGSLDQLLWLRERGAAGWFIYDWGSEVQGNRSGETREQFYAELTRQVTPTWADVPPPTWKTSPTKGIVEGTVSFQGLAMDHAEVMLEGHPETRTVSDGSGWYGILNVEPGSHTLQVSKRGARMFTMPVTVERGKIVTADAAMRLSSEERRD